MKIALNATCMNDRPSGAKQRFLGLYGSLIQELPNTEFVIFEPRDCAVSNWFSSHENITSRSTPLPSTGRLGKFRAGLGYWQKAFEEESFDIYEAMNLPLVRPPNGPSLLTIHDVRGLYENNLSSIRPLFKAVLLQSIKRADRIITVSETMRLEILSFYSETPVSVVFNGINTEEFTNISQSACDKFLKKYYLPRNFVLSVGHLESRKNYTQLIEAMSMLKFKGLNCPLVIVGNDSGEGSSIKEKISQLNMSKDVTLLTGLSDDEVKCAYSSCSLFVFPSTYEGFGIPILEAMAFKKPIALSSLPVFREITEDQAIYFPPNDIEGMAYAIESALTSEELREKIIKYGCKRIQDFSFQTLAKEMVNIYRDLI